MGGYILIKQTSEKKLLGTKRNITYDKGINQYQEDIVILNMYAPNIRILKYMKLKEEVDRSTAIAGDFHTLLSATDKTTRQ